MKKQLYAGLAIAGGLMLGAATTVRVSAMEQGFSFAMMKETSCDTVLEQRLLSEAKVWEESLACLDIISQAEAFPMKRIYEISERDFHILSRIVEAEATDKDIKSKILVANVVINRWKSEEFPDSIEGVVFERNHGAVQFSPTADGRYEAVHVTNSTKESVDRALKGEDYSQGALYFVERSIADADNVSWFDRALTRLFEYEGHTFYK